MASPSQARFVSDMRQIYKRLQENYGGARRGVLIQHGELCVLGIRTSLRNTYDPKELRRDIESMLGLQNVSIVQVVGDSGGELTLEATRHIKRLISSTIDDVRAAGRNGVLEYGFTASLQDANWVVNEVLTMHPELKERTVGNLVYASSGAIESGHFKAMDGVGHFVLAYDESETNFGSDMWMSDSIMCGENGDVLVCAEGGPQAFVQAVSACALQVSVIAICKGLGSMRIATMDTGVGNSARFSASVMLSQLSRGYQDCVRKDLPQSEIRDRITLSAQHYLATLTSLNIAQATMVNSGIDSILQSPRMLRYVSVEHLETGPHAEDQM